jgi:hypothetical protein
MLAWVSIHLTGTHEPDQNIPRFPALLDTGNNVDVAIQDRHLREWAGLDPRLMLSFGDMRINERVAARRRATVWLYPNIPCRMEVDGEKPPFRLKLAKGIAVYAPDALDRGPRLPLLGLPALLGNDLDWWLDPQRRHITVQTRSWRRPLIRLLCPL